METTSNRAPRKRRRGGLAFLFVLFILSAIGVIGWYGYMNYIPSNEQTDPKYGKSYPVLMKGVETSYGAVIENGEVKLPLPLLDELFGEDNPIHYEQESGTIVLTSASKVLRFKTEALTGIMNQTPIELSIAAEIEEDVVYIPAAPLEEMFGIRSVYHQESGIVMLDKEGDIISLGKALPDKGAVLRSAPSIREPYLLNVPSGETVTLWEERDGWYLAQNKDGHIGYIQKREIQSNGTEQVPELPEEKPFIPWKVMGQKINMTWEAVYQRKIDPATIGEMPGVNVVSPTWFELVDGNGGIKGKADPAYVKWAHDRGYQVWGLFSNGFEPDQTTEALSTVEKRFSMIQQLLAFAELYQLQGINVDFENVYTKDKENLVQFVREMTPLMHEQGLVVSIDVTPKSNSEMWSVFLDRKALGSVVDYMMVMAYDEHWAASPKAGSVASLPWTERSIQRILEEDEVPAGKLVLSMPLYTRIWTEKKDESGAVKVSSQAVGMERIRTILSEKGLTPVLDEASGQNYVEYEEEGALKRIWIEDDLSMKARIDLVRKYDLAGVATWARVFQTPSIWTTIDDALSKRP